MWLLKRSQDMYALALLEAQYGNRFNSDNAERRGNEFYTDLRKLCSAHDGLYFECMKTWARYQRLLALKSPVSPEEDNQDERG